MSLKAEWPRGSRVALRCAPRWQRLVEVTSHRIIISIFPVSAVVVVHRVRVHVMAAAEAVRLVRNAIIDCLETPLLTAYTARRCSKSASLHRSQIKPNTIHHFKN